MGLPAAPSRRKKQQIEAPAGLFHHLDRHSKRMSVSLVASPSNQTMVYGETPQAFFPFQGVHKKACRGHRRQCLFAEGDLFLFSPHGDSSRMMLAAFSPTMIAGALVFPDVMVGNIEASATRRLSTP